VVIFIEININVILKLYQRMMQVNQSHIPKICLNMIVKNESKIITRLLESVYKLIDSYIICDTGSTDDTKEIIETFLNERNIQGKIIHEPFQNFGYNRAFALKACENQPNADYILLLDADMRLQLNGELTVEKFKTSLKDDLYYIFQGNEFSYYKNVRIVKNNLTLSYWGVTHEYVSVPPNTNYKFTQFDKSIIFIYDVGDGGSKTNKYERDIQLLTNGLIETPDNDRYLFYLANSYRDTHQYAQAIETYLRRIKVGGWFEEVWQCHYSIGRCAMAIGKPELAIYHWLQGYNVFPQRLENIYEIIHHYRNDCKYHLAYQYYCIADGERKGHNQSLDFLFLEKDVYDWKLDYEMTIIAYYRNSLPFNTCNICMKVLAYPFLENHIASNILSNYKFYAKKLLDMTTSIDHSQKWNALKCSSISYHIGTDFVSSTPTFCMNKAGEIVSIIRYVNYRIAEDGSYCNKERIETKNLISVIDIQSHPRRNWIKKKEFILKYDTTLDNVYVGLEDVRLFAGSNGDIFYNANRGLSVQNIVIQHGKIDELTGNVLSSVLLNSVQKDGVALLPVNNIEKNWVLFEDGNNQLKMIHSWCPLTIGTCKMNDSNPTLNISESLATPYFFRFLRGSTNGIRIDNEIWFICHTVSHEARRYYYHIFVVLDLHTLQVKRYSPFFTFEGKAVEYTLGMLYFSEPREFMIGYSLFDKETKYMMVSRENIEKNIF
jgi:glycosyltransferase involved in cell wall biosynthesis